jgi:hypothetical protein
VRSIGVPEGAANAPPGAARLIKKNRQFLAKSADDRYCFSEDQPLGWRFARARRDQDFGARVKWLKKK